MDIISVLFLPAYAAAWWFALWLLLGRPRQPAPMVVLGVALLGFGMPVVLADVAAVKPEVPPVLPKVWAALPVPVLCAFALRWGLGKRGRRPR